MFERLLRCCVAAVLLFALVQGGSAGLPEKVLEKVRQTRRFLRGLADRSLLGGSVIVHDGRYNVVFEDAYGYAVPELRTPLTRKISLPVGSNTKFFTAVALWQLHERGLLNMDDPVTKYMDNADFNKTTDWCPKLRNGTDCLVPTLKQLMFMGSGMIDTDNCGYAPGSWQLQYCITEDQLSNLVGLKRGILAGVDPAEYFAAMGLWDVPLEATPGTTYKYVNAGFILGAYVVEKLSGLKFGPYLRTHIFGPAGLTNTHYDITYAYNGAIRNRLPDFGYRTVISPVSQEYLDYVGNTSSKDTSYLKSAAAGQVVDITRNWAIPNFVNWGNGAGAIYATPRDMVTWWHTLLFKPQALNLTRATVKQLLTSYNPEEAPKNSGYHFAQGIVVKPNTTVEAFGVTELFYQGGINNILSPFLLKFLNTAPSSPKDTSMVGGVYLNEQLLSVPFNASSCIADNPWGNPVKFDADLCGIVSRGTTNYVASKLFNIWQPGAVPKDPASA
eukprot:CAMPEP_0202903162 /NCGR_PEP_ID=MMETSP1392-20130828/22106_1 /ASSEMBLY_ACC=CAM_ASM_000868 /TAXON_ID=225041 /ORGANISM="Chlamydomonas chlamydogama, Strain SAG 11-48b" /LENGTH=499 /DNA_ID=CAMNT_0049590175 /DNA_START=62 /DNA_END=1561 /DNA_ORIENTATION=-